MDYNKTIQLPQTDFPMRAGLPQREPEMLRRWQEMDLYRTLLEKNEGKPRFSLHDGPPFSNGGLHMGHALNKTLKDIITRSYAMRGRYTPYVPGWDNHGMPIESAIIKEKKLKRKDMSISEFRTACRDYAEQYVEIQKKGFERLGVLGDWARPYRTMDPAFEARETEIFGTMYQKGYIYKGLKPVYWCCHDETALAEAEIEYQDDPCTTVYVKFPLKDDLGKLGHLDKSKLSFVIWTTTVWTLPGNMAIALHPREKYAIVQHQASGELYVIAEALVGQVMKAAGIGGYVIAQTHEGAFFENMTARHPFLPKTSRLVTAEYVTMDSGTGCVHTAPGFGADDYQTCRRYGLEMVVPVDGQGRHTDYAGKYAGMKVEESNAAILADMKASGALLASAEIVHSYPHCWRCKHPVIFRATPQWFCSVEAFKDEACDACDAVQWIPAWGSERIKSMIRERADWCISRQRLWGLPIPVVYCRDCKKPVCTDESIRAISALFAEKGSNAWFDLPAEAILPQGFACPHCGKQAGFEKETDTLDGWFDSGSSHAAAMRQGQGFWPADLYLEGLDQYRGWFQSSLLTAVAALGEGAPFRACLTHGWTVDGEGKAMHKSLGNGMDPYQIMDKYGADLLRLWAASADYHADVRCSDAIFKQLSQNYLKFRNTARYCLGNLHGFDPDAPVSPAEMLELDRWAVTRLNALTEKCARAYEAYEFLTVTHAVNDFCVVELSNFYLDVIKDRLYCEAPESLKRRSAQSALYLILDTLTRLMAPILCFTADEIWQCMPHRQEDDVRNVVLNDMQQPYTAYALSDEDMERWSRIGALRDTVNSALEAARTEKVIGKSLEAAVTLTLPPECAFVQALEPGDLADILIVSQTHVTPGASLGVQVTAAGGTKCPRCWKHSLLPGLDGLCPRCVEVVSHLPSL